MALALRLSCMPKAAYTVVLQAATMAATNQAPSMEEESEAAKALWEITNSPGLAKKGPSCLTPRGPAGRDHLLGFPTPQGVGHGSPSMNYNRFFSPSQFSWSPLPGHSPAPQANAAHPSHGNHSSSSMPSFFSSLASTTTTAIAATGTGAGGDEATAAADKAAAAALYAAAGMGGGEGKAGSVVKKKAYSKKLDFAGPSSEKASRVWLSLDTETQRVARTGPRAAPPASPAVAGGGKDSQFFVTQSPFKYQGDGLEDFFASATGSSSSSGSGSNSSSSSRVCRPGGEAAAEGKGQDAADLLLQGAEEDLGLDQQQKWEGGFEGGREGGREEGQLQAVELLTDETSRMSSCGSVDSRGLPFTPLPVNAITMNQHGGSNWGGIQVRVKKTTPNHTHYQHDPSLLEALAAMLPLHDDASHSPSLPTSSGSHSNSSYHSSMPPPQSPRTTTATSRGKFAPGSPVLEAMAMVTLSQSPSVFSSDRKKKKNSLRAPHSAPRVLIPSGSSIGSTSFSSLSSNITITNAAAAAAAAAAGATHPYQTPNSATKKAAHLVAAGKKNSPDSSSCSCKKSRCLKLYCECFRGGFTCGASCKCQNCANTPEFEVERAEAREKIEEKKRRKSGGGRQSLGTGEDGMVSFSMAASRPVLAETEVEEQQEEQEHQALLPMSLSHSHATRRSTRCAGVPATTTGGNIVFTLKQPSSSSSSSSSFFFSTTTMTPVQHRKGKRKNEGEEEDPIAAAAATAVLSKPLRRTTPSKGGRKDEFLLSVFGPRSKINKQNSLEVLSYLDRDDMADACLVSSLWNRLALETLDE